MPFFLQHRVFYRPVHQGKMLAITVAIAASLGMTNRACAADPDRSVPLADAAAASTSEVPEQWALHGQLTNVTQGHRKFSSPYSGANSLDADGRTEETTDLTLYAGMRLWRGAELWLNPEIDQGFGLSGTVGMAGFPSGEAYKIGANAPYLRIPRAFVRQVFALGGGTDDLDPAANQLGGPRPTNNVTITLGKFSVVDIFDTNTYAHDPRADFMNWSIIDAGSMDYAADAWGFTYGGALEWTQGGWTLRGGLFQLSKIPNGKITAVDFSQYSVMAEVERRNQWYGHPGKIKVTGFFNRGRMGSYRDALQLARDSGTVPDTTLVRKDDSNSGLALNLEQELTRNLGLFARASFNNGSKEAYEFTEINQSLSAGLSLKGRQWGRPDDIVGMALAINGLSAAARDYFSASGIGILIGDGALRYGPEKIVETYYSMRIAPQLQAGFNYQHVNNPAHNRDRGPVSIFGARLHAEF